MGWFLGRLKKERRTRWPCVKFKQINSDLGKPGRLAHAQDMFLRTGTKPKKSHKIYLLFLFLPLIRFFYWNSLWLVPCLLPPPRSHLAKGGRDSAYLPKTNRLLCSIILVLGNNDQGIPKMGCGNSGDVKFHLRSLERNKYPRLLGWKWSWFFTDPMKG